MANNENILTAKISRSTVYNVIFMKSLFFLFQGDLFELGKADILTQVASLQVLPPTQW